MRARDPVPDRGKWPRKPSGAPKGTWTPFRAQNASWAENARMGRRPHGRPPSARLAAIDLFEARGLFPRGDPWLKNFIKRYARTARRIRAADPAIREHHRRGRPQGGKNER